MCGSDRNKQDIESKRVLFFFPRSKCLAPQSRKEILCFPSAFVSMAVALVRQVINKGDFRGKLCLEAEGQEETKSEA